MTPFILVPVSEMLELRVVPAVPPQRTRLFLLVGLGLERLTCFGVRALLALYLIQRLQLTRTDTRSIYEAFTLLVYLLPVLGAWFVDRWWGSVRSLHVGSGLLVLGTAALALSGQLPTQGQYSEQCFLLGLGLIGAATCFLRPAYSAVVGHLTRAQPVRELPTFYWLMLVLNVGVVLAPLVIGAVGDTGDPEDFRWGFLLCAVVALAVASVAWGLRTASLPEGAPDHKAAWWTWLMAAGVIVVVVRLVLRHLAFEKVWATGLEIVGAVILLLLSFFETTWNVLVPVALARELPPHLLARSLSMFFLLFTLS